MKGIVFWILIVICLVAGWAASDAVFGGISEAIDATCRVSGGPGTAMGTGIAVYVDGDDLYVLTNAHVVGRKNTAVCDFWVNGRQTKNFTGTVVLKERKGNKDIAVIRISLNGQVAPSVIPIASTAQFPVNTPIASVGVGGGVWPTAFIGHVKAYQNDGDTMLFVPSPANGRSGSAIMDESCTAVIGLLHARNPKENHGKAMSLQGIQEVLAQCGPGGCPIPNRNFNLLGRQVVPPTPPQTPLGNGVDAQARAELAVLRAEVARLGEIARRAEEAGLLAGDALEAAEEAQGDVAEVLEEVENGGLFARLKDRVASTAVGAVISKLGLPALGISGGVIGILIFLVRKDIKDLRENGDPLWISKIAEKTSNTIDDKVAAKVTKVVESDFLSGLLKRLGDRVTGGDDNDDSLLEKLSGLREKAKKVKDLFGDDKPTIEPVK